MSTELVFISSCSSELSGNAFVEAGVPHVVAVKVQERVTGEPRRKFRLSFAFFCFCWEIHLPFLDGALNTSNRLISPFPPPPWRRFSRSSCTSVRSRVLPCANNRRLHGKGRVRHRYEPRQRFREGRGSTGGQLSPSPRGCVADAYGGRVVSVLVYTVVLWVSFWLFSNSSLRMCS